MGDYKDLTLEELSIMPGDQWEIGDYVYILEKKTGRNLEKTGASIHYKKKLKPQEIINLKLNAVSFRNTCPDAINKSIYKIIKIEKYDIFCKEIKI